MKPVLLFVLLFSSQAFSKLTVNQPSFQFTGYKFTEKAPVSGTFKDIQWTYEKESNSIEELLLSGSIIIDSFTVSSGDKIRDNNLLEGIFKVWGSRQISAKVISIDKKTNKLSIELKVGENIKLIDMNYSIKGTTLAIAGKIDLLELGFSKAYAKLSKLCKAFHIGVDGINKTWSEVGLKLTANINPSN
ncbi:MAG: hypothetical protein AB8E15_02430 [Bdellovibrionales bacterium]